MPPDVKEAIHAIWQELDRVIGVNNVDWHGRRIINAGDAVNDQDYVTKAQLDALEASGVAGPPGPAGKDGEDASGGGMPPDLTLLTEADETWALPFSRKVLAGNGVAFDDTTGNARTISTLVIRGTRALRPSAASVPGELYFFTDTVTGSVDYAGATTIFYDAVVEYSNGTTWLTYSALIYAGGVSSLAITGDLRAQGDFSIDGAALFNGNVDVMGAIDATWFSAAGTPGIDATLQTTDKDYTVKRGLVVGSATGGTGGGGSSGYAQTLMLMGG